MTTRHFWLALLAAVSLLTGVASVAQDQDVIPPEQVFKYTTASDAQKIYLKFAILDGYYLYRARFGFDTSTPGVTLSAPEFPRGEIHSDEYFGEQEIYRGKFEIAIPYRRSSAASSAALELRLQGCADRGLCYVPQSWDAAVGLPAASPLRLGAASPTLGATTDDLLPAEEAFVMNARFDKPNELTVGWQIAPNYYLYRDKFTFTVDGKVELGRAALPKGKAHHDDNFGDVEVFYDYVEAKVPFSRASPDALDVVVTGGFQGCKDDSICYPPGEQTMSLVLPATSDFPASAVASSSGGGPVSEQDKYVDRIVNGSWWTMIGVFFLAGLALSLTPCVLPMVPILSSIIAGQGGTVSTSRGFLLSLSYVLGMAATYTAAGALAALAGGQIQAMFQKPWIVTLFASVFFVLALGMFGLFELQMPTAIQTRLSQLADKQKAARFSALESWARSRR